MQNQTSNKYTKIPNDFMDALYSPSLTEGEMKVLLFVARKTWGWQKESDKISYSQFQKETGLSKPTVVKTLKKLQVVKFLTLVKKGNVRGDCNEWKIEADNIPSKVVNLLNLRLLDNKKVVKLVNHTKESYTKEKLAGVQNDSSREQAWKLYSMPYLEEKGISDPSVIQAARQAFVSKAKATTQRSVQKFIDKQCEITPPAEFADNIFKKMQLPKEVQV